MKKLTTSGWKIGRPGLGGEFLQVEETSPMADEGRYVVTRRKRVNYNESAPRQMKVGDLPAGTLLYDLTSVMESIVLNEARRGRGDRRILDDHGVSGKGPSLRERWMNLASAPDEHVLASSAAIGGGVMTLRFRSNAPDRFAVQASEEATDESPRSSGYYTNDLIEALANLSSRSAV